MSTYTHGHGEAVLRNHGWRNATNSAGYLLPLLTSGLSLLDVGCGPGTITTDLAARVSPGRVLGMDMAPTVIAAAQASGGPANLRYAVGNVHHLGDADTWDVVHAHQVLQHLENPAAAIREMMRVCKPGGTVAVRDADYASMNWWPLEPGIERWREIYRHVARTNGGEPDAGRRLLRWAREAGATTVTPSASVWCFATLAEREWWAGTWAERISVGPLAESAVRMGQATHEELQQIATGWRNWAADPDGWFVVVNSELLISV